MENISAAKKELEKKIIGKDYVTNVGTRILNANSYIEVGVIDEKFIPEIEKLLTSGKWKGFEVRLVLKKYSKPI